MHLDSYISDLLYRYDCVTVPSFGAFLTERVPARIDEDSSLLSPPTKRLSFNEQLQKNDGLLAAYLANTENIPYEVAVQKIERHVKSIKSYLIEGETITIQNVGELLLNKEGKINFEPFYKINYLTGSFGLSPISSNLVLREEASAKVRQLEEKIPITISPEKRRKRVPYFKYAAVAVIALLLGGAGGSALYSNQIEKQNLLAQQQAAQELDSKIQEATFVIPNSLPTVTLKVEKQSGNYHVVAGAFRMEENSIKKIEQLREQGYKARSIGVNKYGLHEVVYSSHEDRNEARRILREVRQSNNPDAWLLVRDLK